MANMSDKYKIIDEIIRIKSKSPNQQTNEDYDRRNFLTKKLYRTISLHDAFSDKYPQFCLNTVIWIDELGDIHKIKSNKNFKIYSSDGIKGATIRIHPDPENLFQCLSSSKFKPNGAYLYFKNHSNIIWVDPLTKRIDRYDPQMGKESLETHAIDSALKKFFNEILPDYQYMGNTLRGNQVVQGVIEQKFGLLDSFCQEYTLMYAKNRLEGMSHSQAASDLIKNVDRIYGKIKEFYLNIL